LPDPALTKVRMAEQGFKDGLHRHPPIGPATCE
jgi:hypothetical protein